jgi:hypothetical protein
MIDDLSRSLELLLTRPGLPPELSLAQISFESPAPPFSPAQTTVNLFLFDIQENTELRSSEPKIVRNGNQAILQQPPPRVACSYLVTAWPAGGIGIPLIEQLLLSQVFTALAAFPAIPQVFLAGALSAGQEPLPPMTVARGDELRHNAEFWTALGGKLRAALRVTATISIPVFEDRTAFLVTSKSTHYAPGLDRDAAPVADPLVQIGGRVISDLGVALAGAVVDILDAGLRTRTDQEGRFSFPLVPAGVRRFRAIATGFQPLDQNRPVPGTPGDYLFQLSP